MCDTNLAKRDRDSLQMDVETQVPEAKRPKYNHYTKEEVLKDLRLSEIVLLFNTRIKRETERYICSSCNKLCVYEPHMLASPGHIPEPYCDDCVIECEGCGDVYNDDLAYRHESCVEESDEEEDEEVEVMNPDGTIKTIRRNV